MLHKNKACSIASDCAEATCASTVCQSSSWREKTAEASQPFDEKKCPSFEKILTEVVVFQLCQEVSFFTCENVIN